MPLQVPMQGRAGQVRARRLKGIREIIGNSVCLRNATMMLRLQVTDIRLRIFRASWQVGRRVALLPFGEGPSIDAVAPGQSSQALLTML